MLDWNVVVSVRGAGYKAARRYLKTVAQVERTDYYNVLALRVDDAALFLEAVKRDSETDPALREALARVIPVTERFTFQTPEEFAARAREAVRRFQPQLAGQAFYVRMHRRGFRGLLSSQAEERKLDAFLLEQLAAAGTPGTVRFADADAVVVIETLGQRAGLALVTRATRGNYPFVEPE